MARFYDDSDIIEPKQKKPRKPRLPREVGHTSNIHNDVYMNDYRNRMPFHYVSDTEEYYYWQYGSVIEVEFTISDEEVKVANSIYLSDILENGKSIVDEKTKIANLILGSMSQEDKDLYITAQELRQLVAEITHVINNARQAARRTNRLLDRIDFALHKGGEQVNSVLIEELQHQMNELRKEVQGYTDRIVSLEEAAAKAIERLDSIDTLIAGSHYSYRFTKDDWEASSDYYVLTVPTEIHTIKKPYVIAVYAKDSSVNDYLAPIDCDIQVHKTGEIKIYVYKDLSTLDEYSGIVLLGGVNE